MNYLASLALVGGGLLFATACDKKSNEPTTPDTTPDSSDTIPPVTPDTIPVEAITFKVAAPAVYAQSAIIEVTPLDDEVYYYVDALATDTLNAYFATDAELQASDSAYFQDAIAYYEEYGYDFTVEDFLYKGKQTLAANSTLLPNTEYTVYAYQVNPKTGAALTEVTKTTFTTKDSYTSTNEISFSFTDEAVTIHTTDVSPYFFYVYDKTTWGYIAGDSTQTVIASYVDLITGIWAQNNYYIPLLNGDVTIAYDELEDLEITVESGENVFLAVPYDGKVNGTAVFASHDITLSGSTTGAPAKAAAKAEKVKAPAAAKSVFGVKALKK